MKIHLYLYFELKFSNIKCLKTTETLNKQYETQFWSNSSSQEHLHRQFQPSTISADESSTSLKSFNTNQKSRQIFMHTILIRALKQLRIERRFLSRIGILIIYEHQERLDVKLINSRILGNWAVLNWEALFQLSTISGTLTVNLQLVCKRLPLASTVVPLKKKKEKKKRSTPCHWTTRSLSSRIANPSLHQFLHLR